nr:MAG TPA: hypothetical protein [Caudoviricetes sp.]
MKTITKSHNAYPLPPSEGGYSLKLWMPALPQAYPAIQRGFLFFLYILHNILYNILRKGVLIC